MKTSGRGADGFMENTKTGSGIKRKGTIVQTDAVSSGDAKWRRLAMPDGVTNII